ncbi:MAG: DUF6468 domain-containing protein [Alphaproteobacteria bacterium]
MEILKLILDMVIIGLLGAAIYYGVRLERQLATLRSSHTDMQRYTQDFARDVSRAESGIKNLKQVARDAGDDMEKLLEQCRVMGDELRFVIDRADHMAAKIGNAPLRQAAEPPPPLRSVAPTAVAETPAPKSRAERELLQALQKIKGGGA